MEWTWRLFRGVYNFYYFFSENQVIFIGEYSDGKKFGRWNKNILKVKEDEL